MPDAEGTARTDGEQAAQRYVVIEPGDPAPSFRQRSTTNPQYNFDTAAGRYLVLCFFGSSHHPAAPPVLDAVMNAPSIFNDERASFFGVTADPADAGRVAERMPGVRFFLDFDLAVSRLYGSAPVEAEANERLGLRLLWIVIDPTMRVLKVIEFDHGGTHVAEVLDFLEALPLPAVFAGPELQAPILYLPNVFEPDLCRRLIELYEAHGGEASGFMREIDGRTVVVADPDHKRRRDCSIEDETLVAELKRRVQRRIVPEIAKAHQFKVTRIERNIVACYRSEDQGFFRAHRDNTTKGTAHRRFAVSINLNEEFEGGEIHFPEYGPRGFKPPPGGAVVFSCSLLHAVSPVTAGRRYAFLPFLYDDAAALVREANNRFLGPGMEDYIP